VQQEPFHDLPPAPRAHLHRRTVVVVIVVAVVVIVQVVVVHGASQGWAPASKWWVLIVWVLVVVVVWSRVRRGARTPWGVVVVVVVMVVGPHHVSIAHGVREVRLRSGLMWVRGVPVVIVVVRGRGVRRVQLRVGVIMGVHSGDGTRGQLAGVTSQIWNKQCTHV